MSKDLFSSHKTTTFLILLFHEAAGTLSTPMLFGEGEGTARAKPEKATIAASVAPTILQEKMPIERLLTQVSCG